MQNPQKNQKYPNLLKVFCQMQTLELAPTTLLLKSVLRQTADQAWD
jgi:hypothetical protein